METSNKDKRLNAGYVGTSQLIIKLQELGIGEEVSVHAFTTQSSFRDYVSSTINLTKKIPDKSFAYDISEKNLIYKIRREI